MRLDFKKIAFMAILILAFVLRFYDLGKVPSSLDWDEVSNSYNAYSILKTGKDEYGNFMPLANRSFDDYKPPLYMYLDVLSIKLFGLNNFSSRLPSATLGFLTVPLFYLLVKKLFSKEKIALASMFLLSISPWHIQFSRVGFEANLGLFFVVASVYAIVYSLKNYRFTPFAALLAALSFYSYHSERIFIPLIAVSLFFIFKKEIFLIPRKYLLTSIVLFVLAILPLLIFNPRAALIGRFNSTSSEEARKDLEKSLELRSNGPDDFFHKVITSSKTLALERYFSNYLSYFDPNFLFLKGDDNYRHHVEGFGVLYLFELPFVLYGIFTLIKNKDNSSKLILFWLLLSPIPAIPATPNPHAVRSLQMVIPLEVASAIAISALLATKRLNRVIVYSILFSVMAITLVGYLNEYYSHYPINKADFWQFGYSQAATKSNSLSADFQKVYISPSVEQAYIFWLYYNLIDPETYQATNINHNFAKFNFNEQKPKDSSILYVAASDSFPKDFVSLETINYPNGSPAIKIGHAP